MSKPVGPYTPIVRAGDWLVVSGQIGAVEGKLVEGGMREQLTQVLKNLRGLLEGEGSSLDQVVKCTVFLTDMSDFAAMNEIYKSGDQAALLKKWDLDPANLKEPGLLTVK